MGDHGKHESADIALQVAPEDVQCNAERVEQTTLNDGLVSDADTLRRTVCQHEELIDRGSETIMFFASFFDNLGPRYQAHDSEAGLLLTMTPVRRSHSDKSDFDELCKRPNKDCFTATMPKLREVTPRNDDATLHTPNSSRRAAAHDQDPASENFDNEELTSTLRPLIAKSSESRGGTFQSLPVSSTASNSLRRSKSYQSLKTILRYLQSREMELEDHGSSSFTSRRLRRNFRCHDFRRIGLVFPSWRDDEFEEILHVLRVARSCRSAPLRNCLRMPMSPFGRVRSPSKQAREKTLITLQHWHSRLGLENPACPAIAFHIFSRAIRRFQRSAWTTHVPETHDQFWERVLMATALWLAAKVVDVSCRIPTASRMASTASITTRSLIHSEFPVLEALQWNLVQY